MAAIGATRSIHYASNAHLASASLREIAEGFPKASEQVSERRCIGLVGAVVTGVFCCLFHICTDSIISYLMNSCKACNALIVYLTTRCPDVPP